MNQKYNEIMELFGVKEFKSIIKKWDILSENMEAVVGRPRIVLPDLLWIMNSGVGRTNLLNHLAEYLYSKGNLMDFSGDVKFFEFILNYHSNNPTINEIQRFMDSVRKAAGFRNEFRGVICIDVDEWTNHYEDKRFVSFLELLASHSEEWLIVLSVSETENLDNFIAAVSTYLRIETLKIEMPVTDDLLVYVKNKLLSHGLSTSDKNDEKIKCTIEKLKENKNFDGFKTLDMLVQDIVYEHFCVPDSQKGELPDTIIEKFTSDSEYINRLNSKKKSAKTIGF